MPLSKAAKSPFVGFSVEEVLSAEACSYVILVGTDFYVRKGQMVFTKRTAVKYYNEVLTEVVNQMYNGSAKQKANANRVLLSLCILPLRIN